LTAFCRATRYPLLPDYQPNGSQGLDEKLNLLQNRDIAHYRYPQNRNIVQEIYSYLWYSLCIEVP
jgi:hypothetical protein